MLVLWDRSTQQSGTRVSMQLYDYFVRNKGHYSLGFSLWLEWQSQDSGKRYEQVAA